MFLPGEREIREAADHLRKHLSHQPVMRNAEVLPLFARLSQAEQDRIFDGHSGRRIVLATNVAETSLTVPGIRYVIDAGTARVKRYSFSSKVEQLLVEPISQAAANQRAGRCGRVANGICIRLYDEKDFDGRPRFTDPEILRSSLAGVILRMKSLHLGMVEDFPFHRAPVGRAIADGYQLLNELGAVDDANELTPMGQRAGQVAAGPARGPHDSGGARARGAGRGAGDCLGAERAGRARPADGGAAAGRPGARQVRRREERVHRLPEAVEVARRARTAAATGTGSTSSATASTSSCCARTSSTSAACASGATSTASCTPWWPSTNGGSTPRRPATSSCTCPCCPACWATSAASWRRRRRAASTWARAASSFIRHPGAHLSKKPGRWIVAAELVETTRLFGRGIAAIEPQWLEQVGGHLLKKQLLDPHWEKKAAEVVALERATLYGIVVYSGRRVNYGRVDLAGAREIFIREALVGERVGDHAAVSGRQPEADQAGGGPGAQGAPAGRAGGRRADLRLLRPAAAGRCVQRLQLRALVPRGSQEATRSCCC